MFSFFLLYCVTYLHIGLAVSIGERVCVLLLLFFFCSSCRKAPTCRVSCSQRQPEAATAWNLTICQRTSSLRSFWPEATSHRLPPFDQRATLLRRVTELCAPPPMMVECLTLSSPRRCDPKPLSHLRHPPSLNVHCSRRRECWMGIVGKTRDYSRGQRRGTGKHLPKQCEYSR